MGSGQQCKGPRCHLSTPKAIGYAVCVVCTVTHPVPLVLIHGFSSTGKVFLKW